MGILFPDTKQNTHTKKTTTTTTTNMVKLHLILAVALAIAITVESASAPAPAKKVAKKAAPAHPKYVDMVLAAVTSLKERSGSSKQAILKYIIANYKVGDNPTIVNSNLKLALKAGVKSGLLTQAKGTGASGSFKVGEVKKAAKKPKKKPAAKPKKAKATKKAAAKSKKSKKPTKKAAKKAAKPKKAKKASAKKAKK